jgi:hypothetical protein
MHTDPAESGTVAQAIGDKSESVDARIASNRARGIIDLSGTRLADRPNFLEEKLLKTRGIISAEINAFSNRMTVEFDPSLISLEKIKKLILLHAP